MRVLAVVALCAALAVGNAVIRLKFETADDERAAQDLERRFADVCGQLGELIAPRYESAKQNCDRALASLEAGEVETAFEILDEITRQLDAVEGEQ